MAKREFGTLRIIGGEWRSRLVEFDADVEAGVRATPDRVRQTLFDWLAPVIDGARCLDLFAGSGALGLEALSRGARHVSFVDNGRRQVELIRAALATLKAGTRAEVVQADGLSFLSNIVEPYDIVFLDPPYADTGLLASTLALLPSRLSAQHRIYLEWRGAARPDLPPNLRLLREKQAGQVSYALATFSE
jgi:16S rRNA (guanine966-N2)-methyltransferase